jgi:hypothetical protein
MTKQKAKRVKAVTHNDNYSTGIPVRPKSNRKRKSPQEWRARILVKSCFKD